MRAGPTSSGFTTPRPAPSIITGPPMPIDASRVAITTSHRPSSAALPAKQRPDAMPISGTRPLSRPKFQNVGLARFTPPMLSVSAGRPPPPSVKTTTGRRADSASWNIRSCFLWPMNPCVPAKTV